MAEISRTGISLERDLLEALVFEEQIQIFFDIGRSIANADKDLMDRT